MPTLEFLTCLAVLAFMFLWVLWILHTEAKAEQRQRPERAEDYDLASGRHSRVCGPLGRERLP